ncbi:hypothetical protein MCOR27_005936 [Pyricularia oryzae]|uniref:Uncharacterized protein n=1 Tax=Pyricularia grisea TaxID=148305 RepID=A0ABQ8NXM1_PYRGI|nr:hypothetical protein MCOR01_007273 [Pyricularia oryzae]KAI6303615.1 hypothetical protein MCOR33_001308 [Pyricularia grisea]KAI6277592.1 hypothetical protein MCOR27_005936 [Pyricularia oryzae]KAI6277646.1 hypothetical protein MCOR26_005037 [Pyricularia oryzae]KAI6329694.1 hypothetical protein MCOR30_005445 [Pyricularia oryzae]
METGSAASEGDDKQPPHTASTTWSILDAERRGSSSRATDRHTNTPTPHHHSPYGSHTDRPDSYGSGTRVPTDSGSYSQFSSGSSALAGDYWPKVDSDESDEASPSKTFEPEHKQKKSTTKRFFRYLSKKLGTSAPRYGSLPNDEREHDRNEIQHRVILDLFEDKYHLAPLTNPRRVLDVGTGPGLRELGSSVFYPLEYRRILRLAGFVNIQENKYAAPTNACYPGKRLQRIGNLMTRNWLGVIEPLSLPVFGALGWSQESLDRLIDDVKKEIVDPKFHSYMTLMTVSCQKPMSDSAASSNISFTVPPPPK